MHLSLCILRNSYVELYPRGSNPQFPVTNNPLLVPGTYPTAINIHNPNPSLTTVPIALKFKKKALITEPERTTARGTVSDFKDETLLPDQGLEVDCEDIKSLLGSSVNLQT